MIFFCAAAGLGVWFWCLHQRAKTATPAELRQDDERYFRLLDHGVGIFKIVLSGAVALFVVIVGLCTYAALQTS